MNTLVRALVRMDGWVIGRVEKGCHRIQRQFRITNYGLMSIVSLFMAGAVFAMAIYGTSAGATLPKKYFITRLAIEHPIFTILFVVLQLCGAFWSYKDGEAAAFDRLSRGLANPKKTNRIDQVLRMVVYELCPVGVLHLGVSLDAGLLVLMSTYSLLGACDPLPTDK